MEAPLISIVIPVYNGEKYIKRCIDSILNQIYDNFEIVVINDGSTDNTWKILGEYKDLRIKIINQENVGLGRTRNVGIRNIIGDYMIFVDADDFLKEDSLLNYVNILNQEDYDIVLGGYRVYDGKKYVLRELKNNKFDQYNHTEPWNRIYKSSFIKENSIFYKDLRSNEDFVFCLETYKYTDSIKIIEDSGYVYFVENNESITKTMHKHFFKAYHDALGYNIELYNSIDRDKKYIEYKIVKSTIAYLLFSGRHESSSSFVNEYKNLFGLLKSNFNVYISKFIFKESLLYNIVVQGFLFLDKLHLIPLFAKIYCKGKDN